MLSRINGLAEAPRMIRARVSQHDAWSRAMEYLPSVSEGIYLVGGTVRDALRGVVGNDLDLAVDGDAKRVGRRLADSLGGAFYVLDDDHGVCRVVLRDAWHGCHVDLAALRSRTIEEDLAARDFTVNAMAVSLHDQNSELLDPTGGWEDLQGKLIRHAYPRAFDDDPLRLLRAVRQSASLEYTLHASTLGLVRDRCELIKQVSAERVRDELMHMLRMNSPSGLRMALELGLLSRVLTPLPEAELAEGLQWAGVVQQADATAGAATAAASLWAWAEGERHPGKEIDILAALVAPGTPDRRDAALRGLRLSRWEYVHLERVFLALSCAVWAQRRPVDRLDAHRYYRDRDVAGAAAAALVWYCPWSSAERRQMADSLLAWWGREGQAIASPTPLLSGHDLIEGLGLPPGPAVGATLRALVEAQVSGVVADREEAWAWARAALAAK